MSTRASPVPPAGATTTGELRQPTPSSPGTGMMPMPSGSLAEDLRMPSAVSPLNVSSHQSSRHNNLGDPDDHSGGVPLSRFRQASSDEIADEAPPLRLGGTTSQLETPFSGRLRSPSNLDVPGPPSMERSRTGSIQIHAAQGGAGMVTKYHSQEQLRDTALAAINMSMDAAMRSEMKKMREELTTLRKEAQRAAHLAAEVEQLRNVTLLQHEEKVPIRMRELERENLSLRRQVTSLEEKVSALETEDYRRRMTMQLQSVGGASEWTAEMDMGRPANKSFAGSPIGAGSPLEAKPRTASGERRRTLSNSPAIGPSGGGRSGRQASPPGRRAKGDIIIKADNIDTCANCRLKIATLERVARTEKKDLQDSLQKSQAQLDAANAEITAISNWVKTVVANAHQFPNHAMQQTSAEQLTSFASPRRALDPNSSLGTSYYTRHADPRVNNMSGLRWSSAVAPPASYLESRRR